MHKTLAIIGRANVGKSSVFNRLASHFDSPVRAVVSPKSGTTKDGKQFRVAGLGLTVRDTPAFDPGPSPSSWTCESEIALVVLDAQEGVTPVDRKLAEAVRAQVRADGLTPILVANKAESAAETSDDFGKLADMFELDLGEPVFLSALNSHGWTQLLDERLHEHLQRGSCDLQAAAEEEAGSDGSNPADPVVALVGRPNTGKSSLLNALVRREVSRTDTQAGTTTDAVEVLHQLNKKRWLLLDTAGVGNSGKGDSQAEGGSDTRRAMRRADVLVLVMDAAEIARGGAGLSRQEMALGREAAEMGKCVVLAVNKWDLVQKSKQTLLRRAVEEKCLTAFAQVKGLPIIFLSAKTGLNVQLVLKRTEILMHKWQTRISTAQLNEWLRKFVVHHPAPWKDKMQCHLKFVTQVATKPPTFAIWTNIHHEFPDNYLQLLKNTMRDEFKLHGTPIVLHLRTTFVPKKVMKAMRFAPKNTRRKTATEENNNNKKFFDVV